MRRALGKGLSQLIGEQADTTVLDVPVDAIMPNARQPRTVFDEEALADLSASIAEVGILQPLVVRPLAEGKYELIAGERRLRACKRAGLATVPVLVRAADTQASLAMALIENLQREDISAMECARAYRRLMDEFGLTQELVADKVGKSRVAIANTVRLVRLPIEVQEGLESGAITEGHARALLALDGPIAQSAMYRKILARGLSVREVERETKGGAARPGGRQDRAPKAGATDPNMRALEDGLAIYFTPVRIERSEVGGRIVVDFYSDDDLQRILEVLGISL